MMEGYKMKYKNKWLGGAALAVAAMMMASCASDNDTPTNNQSQETVVTEISDSICDVLAKSSIEEFLAFAKMPRSSFRMERCSAYLTNWAKEHKLEYGIDDSLNVWIDLPANTKEMESMPKVILQAHQDMVCAWKSGETHDPTTEVGEPYYDGNNLKGKNINLGADDGIGVGMALAIAKTNVAHGLLRLLFTTNEDCGMYGVMSLDPKVLDADYLISFDDEDYPKVTTGCQGAYVWTSCKKYELSNPSGKIVNLNVTGLLGGHSGATIGEKRLSAATILAKVTKDVITSNGGKLMDIDCGTAINAIANVLTLQFTVDADKAENCKSEIENILENFKKEFTDETAIASTCSIADAPFTNAATVSAEELLTDLNKYFEDVEQGVVEREGTDGLVIKSGNIGIVKLSRGELSISSSIRSFKEEWINSEKTRFSQLASTLSMELGNEILIPAWDTEANDPFIGLVFKNYQAVDNKAYKAKAMGGLECAYFVKKKPGINTAAMGPTIKGAHTIDEVLDTTTVKPLMKVVMNTLQQINTLK